MYWLAHNDNHWSSYCSAFPFSFYLAHYCKGTSHEASWHPKKVCHVIVTTNMYHNPWSSVVANLESWSLWNSCLLQLEKRIKMNKLNEQNKTIYAMYNAYIQQITFNKLNKNMLSNCSRLGNLLKEEGWWKGNLLHAIGSTWINLLVSLSNLKTNSLTITITKKCKIKGCLPNNAFNSHGSFNYTNQSCDDMSEVCA